MIFASTFNAIVSTQLDQTSFSCWKTKHLWIMGKNFPKVEPDNANGCTSYKFDGGRSKLTKYEGGATDMNDRPGKE